MRKHVLLYVLSLVFLLSMAACSPSDNTAPGEEETQIPVLEEGDTVHFTLLQTTDVHHHVVGTGPSASYGTEDDTTLGGYSRLARRILTIRDEKEAAGIPTLLVDSGDYFMGTVYDMSLGKSPAALNFFESMDYDAITIGNHELDYGPTPLTWDDPETEYDPETEDDNIEGFFPMAIGRGPVSKFNVPVVISNMETHDHAGMEKLKADGVIKESLIRTLDNGLKVGIIGLLGKNAASDSPMKHPLTFTNDLTNNDVVAEIQAKVNALKNEGAHIVVALSHSGITNPNSEARGGDDVTLAEKVNGIDIIASGHEHQRTNDVVVVNGTRIICAGKYGEYLAQLDVTVTVGTGVIEAKLATSEDSLIDSDIMQFGFVQVFLVGALDAAINENLVNSGLPKVNKVLAVTDSDNLSIPAVPSETGIGNLAADSLRYANPLDWTQGIRTMSIVPNGIIRNGYAQGQQISFADIYNTLPLGMSPDTLNQDIPGYPLVKIYLDKVSIRNVCQLAAYTLAAHNPTFMGILHDASDPMYGILLNLKADYYLNFSGVRYAYDGHYSVLAENVSLYGYADFSCQGATLALGDAAIPAYVPCVVDLYTALMFLDPSLQGLLAMAGLQTSPMVKVGADYVALTNTNWVYGRLDRDPETEGMQETKEWMALLKFMTNLPAQLGLNSEILDSQYGSAALATGNASRVNVVVPD